jgi:hypothetical protein
MILSTGRLLAAAAVILVAVAAAGWIGRTTAAVGDTPRPAPTAGASASAAPTLESYRQARNVICNAASARLNPLKSRFLGIWNGSITPAQRADWVAGLTTFTHGYEQLATDLDGLAPPPDLAAGHAANVSGLRDLTSLIQSVAADLAAGKDAQAQGVDQAINPLGARGATWETSLNLAPCP